MAPADLLVQSAEYGRGLFTAPPRSPCTSPVNQAFDLRLKGPSGCSPHKGERAPHVLSPIKVDNKIKHSRSTKRRHELQYASSNFLYCIVQKNVPAAGDDLQPVDTTGFASINLTVKAEPDLDDFCPLLKSLSRPNHLPITQVPKHEHSTGFAVKMKPDQDLKLDSESRVFDRKDSIPPTATIPGTPDAGHCSNQNSRGVTSTHTSTGNVVRPPLFNDRRISPYSRLVLDSYLRRLLLRRIRINRRLAPAAAQDSQPPEENEENLPNHRDAPQSTRLLKSLYGLAQCLRSQPEASGSSLNHSDTSNTPEFNQEQSDGAQDSNTNGAANGSVNNSGQHTNSGANETNELGLADLDPSSLYQLGTFLRTLALQLDSHSANAGTSQNALDSVYMSPDFPAPWHTHMNDPGSHGDFLPGDFSSTSGTQTLPQSHFAEPYPGSPSPSQQFSPSVNGSQPQTDVNASAITTSAHIRSFVGRESSSYVHSDEYGHLLPDDIMLNQHFPALNSHDNSVAIPNPNVNSGVHQYVHVFRAGRLDPEPSTLTGAHRTRGPNSNICEVCGKGFRRSGYLKSHMHLHTGVKLHQCPHCHKCLAYPSGLSKHVKRCAAKVRQPKQ
ncbi:unnamed protein product, partial [Rhizoctonia solani]